MFRNVGVIRPLSSRLDVGWPLALDVRWIEFGKRLPFPQESLPPFREASLVCREHPRCDVHFIVGWDGEV
jgi:hypothetical protein